MTMSYQQQPYPYQPQTPPPAPAPPKKQRAWPWILLAAVIGLIIIAVATSPGDEPSSTSSDSEPTATGAPVTAPVKPAAPTGPATTMTSGVYQVGVDVQPGRYKTPGPPADDPMGMCYWSRLKDDSGAFESIITNGLVEGPGSVTINKGEFLELTGGCTWTLAA